MATKAACQTQSSDIEELQRQIDMASQCDSEVMQLREAMQRVVAEKERYKVASNCGIHFSYLLTFVLQAAAHALASPFTHMPGGAGSVSPHTPTALAPARTAFSEERRPSFM
jgi:hypothetical protein